MSTNSSVQIIIHISKLLKKKTILNKHMQINDTRILGVLQNWEYYILLMDISFQFFYNAGNIQEYGWWVLPAISLCMRIDNVFFVIRLRLCNSLFPWHFSVVNCLSTVPSSISLLTHWSHYTVILGYLSTLLRQWVPWAEGTFSEWIQLLNEITRSCLVN